MRNYSKTGGKKGKPGYRTASFFVAQKAIENIINAASDRNVKLTLSYQFDRIIKRRKKNKNQW